MQRWCQYCTVLYCTVLYTCMWAAARGRGAAAAGSWTRAAPRCPAQCRPGARPARCGQCSSGYSVDIIDIPGVEAHAEHGAAHGGGLDPARHRQRGLGRAVVRRLHRRPAQQVHVAGHAQLQMELSINFDITWRMKIFTTLTSVLASTHFPSSGCEEQLSCHLMDSATISCSTATLAWWSHWSVLDESHLVFVRVVFMHFIQCLPNIPNNVHHILHFHFWRMMQHNTSFKILSMEENCYITEMYKKNYFSLQFSSSPVNCCRPTNPNTKLIKLLKAILISAQHTWLSTFATCRVDN